METTIVIMIVGGLLFAFSNWRARQDYTPGDPPLLPYNGLQFVALLIVFMMAAHVITLLTGEPFKGRGQY